MSGNAALRMEATPPFAPLETAPPARRAALVLHALSARDREWILAKMPDAERAIALALLADLEALGIPADPALVDDVLQSLDSGKETPAPTATRPPIPATPDESSPAGGDPLLALEGADPEQLARILRHEPPGLTAVLLDLREWKWRRPLLRRLGEPLARAVLAASGAERSSRMPSPALRERLVASLSARLRKEADSRLTSSAASPRGRWISRLLGRGARS